MTGVCCWLLACQIASDTSGVAAIAEPVVLHSQPDFVGQSTADPGGSLPSSSGEEQLWEVPQFPLPATQVFVTSIPRWSDDGFAINSIGLQHSFLFGYDDIPPLSITPGSSIHFWSGPFGLDLPPRVYDAYVDIQWQPWQSERSSITLGAAPGFYGDFEIVDRTTFQWTGWLAATHRVSDKWQLQGGVAYLRQLRSNWLPIGGAIWTPDDATRFEFIFPRPKLGRMISADDRWTRWAYLAGEFGGGAWSVADTADTNVLVGYSDLRLVGGYEAFAVTGYQWQAEIGYIFARELSVDAALLANPVDAIMAQFSFAF